MSDERQIQLPDGPVSITPEALEDVDFDPDMTEERAAELVDSVHESPEYAAARAASAKRRRGRPALSGDEGSERVSARVTRDQQVALRRFAQARGRSVGAVVRDAVDEYLSRHAS